jgi:hypothetical protein
MTREYDPHRWAQATPIETPMTEASDARAAVDQHARTTEPDRNQVQPGWRVFDRIGRLLGEVSDRDDASVVVAGGPVDRRGTRVPLKIIAEEDPDEMTAELTVAASELGYPTADGEEG